MPVTAETIDALGTPTVDGAVATLRIGTGGTYHEERLVWHLDEAAWVSAERYSIRQVDINGMNVEGDPSVWNYPFQTDGAGGIDNGFGFQIWPVRQLGLLLNAGLRLQENLSAYIAPTADSVAQLALNWYSLADNDTFLSPAPTNFGVVLEGLPAANQYRFCSTGWRDSPSSPVTVGKNGYPEVYGKGVNFGFRRFTAKYRLVSGDPVSSSNEPSPLPVSAKLFSWLVADNVPVASGSAVAEWPDYSSFARTLKQATSGHRPTLVRNVVNGHAVVRFDGVDDFMQTTVGDSGAQPFTMFIVVKQYAPGNTQQVWVSGGSGSPPLIFRSDATDAIDTWGGSGSDLTYHRGTPWPSPFMIVSVVFNGDGSSVWENATEVVSGTQNGGGWGGLTLGARSDAALPAHIDVAEFVGYYSALGDTDRGAVVAHLMAKYGIT